MAATSTFVLPSDLGASTTTLTNVQISDNGLEFANAQITLPDMLVSGTASDPTLKLAAPMVTLQAQNGSYSLGGTGTMEVRVPDNSQDVELAFTLNSNGDLEASLNQLQLVVAGSSLALESIAVNNDGFMAATSTLALSQQFPQPRSCAEK